MAGGWAPASVRQPGPPRGCQQA